MFARRWLNERNIDAKKKVKEGNVKTKNIDVNIDDITLAAGQKYDNGLRILEALSATGLRSIRYAKEVAGVREIIANDLSKAAVESIAKNVKHNNVANLIVPSQSDAL